MRLDQTRNRSLKTQALKLQEKLISSFDKFEQSLNGSETDSLRKLRTEGIEVFKAKGFPTTKDEEWKYTPLNKSIKRDYDFAAGSGSDIKSEDVDRFYVRVSTPTKSFL